MNCTIIESQPFLEELLRSGAEMICRARNNGGLNTEVKGAYASGEFDEITRPDIEVGQFYFDQIKNNFPSWTCFIEDHPDETPKRFLRGDIGAFFDPLDGTKLLLEGKKGYSTMVGVAVYDGQRFNPILGMFRIIDGEFVWAYDDNKFKMGNLSILGLPRKSERSVPILGRTPIERAGLLTPIAEKLGYDIKYVRGMAPQTLALLKGETDLFIYEPGIGLSDIMPIAPIITYCGGEIGDLLGNSINFTGDCDAGIVVRRGKLGMEHGVIGIREHIEKEQVLEKVSEVYPR